VRRTHLKQLVGPLVQIGDARPELLSVDHILLMLIAQRERVFEDPAGGVRDARLTCHGVGVQLAGSPEQVRMAGLVAGVG
jgi:hypothetical protein